MTEVVTVLGLKSKTGAVKRAVNDLILQELIEYTIPEKTNSRLQKYQLTQKGKGVVIDPAFFETLESKNKLPQSWAQSKDQSRAQLNQILFAFQQNPHSMNELVKALGLKSKTGALKRTVGELLLQELIEYTIPEKPSSRLQKYRLTQKGKDFIENK